MKMKSTLLPASGGGSCARGRVSSRIVVVGSMSAPKIFMRKVGKMLLPLLLLMTTCSFEANKKNKTPRWNFASYTTRLPEAITAVCAASRETSCEASSSGHLPRRCAAPRWQHGQKTTGFSAVRCCRSFLGGRDFAFLHVLSFFFGLELPFFFCVCACVPGGGELCGRGAGMFSCSCPCVRVVAASGRRVRGGCGVSRMSGVVRRHASVLCGGPCVWYVCVCVSLLSSPPGRSAVSDPCEARPWPGSSGVYA